MRKSKVQKKSRKSKLINQSIICVVLVIAVMCVNSINKNPTNVFIKNVRQSLYTSIDYEKTWNSLKEKVMSLINKGDNTNAEETASPDTAGESS